MASNRIACGRCGEWAIQPAVACSRTDGMTLLCSPCSDRESAIIPNGWPINSLADRIKALQREFEREYSDLQVNLYGEIQNEFMDKLEKARREAIDFQKRYNDLFDAYNTQLSNWHERERYLEEALAQSIHQTTEPCQHNHRYYFDDDPKPPADRAIARCMACQQRFYGYKACRICGTRAQPA